MYIFISNLSKEHLTLNFLQFFVPIMNKPNPYKDFCLTYLQRIKMGYTNIFLWNSRKILLDQIVIIELQPLKDN